MISYSNNKPSVLEKGFNGRYLYHWGIEEEKVPTEEGGEQVQYKYNEVAVYAPINAGKIVQAVITEMWDKDKEQKLINEYLAAKLKLYDTETNSEKVAAYKEFLAERIALRDQVHEDCKAEGIE